MKLRDLCARIEAGYAAGRSSADMADLVEDLASRTAEILALIDPATSADDAAPKLKLAVGKTDPKLLNEHGIYGTWDAERGHQVLVYYHPNGIHCDGFVMGGAGYGGGITAGKEGLLAADVHQAWEKSESDYDFHEAMRKMCQ